jgi:glycerophosphoryl diester phosphodiesterase
MSPQIVAHRGIHHALPENSLEAIWKALDDSFWVELDVHAAADGVPVVIHDDALDRTTTRSGPVWSLTSSELKRVPLCGGGLLPTLEDCLARKGAGWLVEIKPYGAHELIRRTRGLLGDRPFIIQSFDPDNVRFAAKLRRCPAALLVGNDRELEVAVKSKWDRVNLHHRLLTAELIERLSETGAQVGAWTVNEEPDIRRVIELGVDTIISDEPWRVRQLVNEREGR